MPKTSKKVYNNVTGCTWAKSGKDLGKERGSSWWQPPSMVGVFSSIQLWEGGSDPHDCHNCHLSPSVIQALARHRYFASESPVLLSHATLAHFPAISIAFAPAWCSPCPQHNHSIRLQHMWGLCAHWEESFPLCCDQSTETE